MPPYIKNTLLNFFSFFLIAFSLYSQDMKSNEVGVLCSFGAGYSAGSIILRKVS